MIIYIEAEKQGNNHPNFIESNTQVITLAELIENNIIPTISDNSLTILHSYNA